MRSLPSKLVAGGLSAGVVLLWWPHVFGRDDAVSWVLRGIAWTLVFELLVLCLRPLETALWAHFEQRRAGRRLVALGARLAPRSPRRHLVAASGLAAVAFSLPLALILEGEPATAERQRPAHVTEVTKVVRVVRPVQVKRVVVRELVRAPATTRPSGPAPTPTATAASPAAVAAGSARVPSAARGDRARIAPADRAKPMPAAPKESATTEHPTAEATPEPVPSPAPAPVRATPRAPTAPAPTVPTPPASSPAPGPAPGPR